MDESRNRARCKRDEVFIDAFCLTGDGTGKTKIAHIENAPRRVVEEHGIDHAEAEKHVLDRDRKRAKYYRHITDQVWGLAGNYDLCLNSSKLGVDKCVDLILNCCK